MANVKDGLTALQAWDRVREIRGWIDGAEILSLFDCADKLNEDAVIVEVGTAFGRSAAILAHSGHKVITIDNYRNLSQSPPSPEYFKDSLAHQNLPITFIKGESTDASTSFKDGSIDLFFLDADHAYHSVKEDINYWYGKVKEGGCIIFHDYESWPGVTAAVNEAIAEGLIRATDKQVSLLITKKV